jgi:hypothetical protein
MKNLKMLHATIAAMFAAAIAVNKSERTDYDACMKLLKTAPLNDADAVKAIRDDLLTTFGDAHKDAAQKRINIVNNARRVAFGGTKDGKAIRGKGHAAMLEVAGTVASVRELQKALAAAVPDALKGAAGGDRTKGKGKKSTKGKGISVPQVATREEAFAAARKVLEFTRDKFTKPSETVLCESINRVLELLK